MQGESGCAFLSTRTLSSSPLSLSLSLCLSLSLSLSLNLHLLRTTPVGEAHPSFPTIHRLPPHPPPSPISLHASQNGHDERCIPGNTVAVQADMPFSGVAKCGSAFLEKFEVAQVSVPGECLEGSKRGSE